MGRDAARVWDAQAYDRSFGFVSRLGRGLVDLLDPQPGERVVDLGCGTGELAGELADLGAQVRGIDADAAMIAEARRRHPGVAFEQADGHAFEVDGQVDAVLSNAALHWMRRPHEVVARVRVALRPGGRFVGELGGRGNVATIVDAVTAAAVAVGVDPARIVSPWYFPSAAQYATVLEDGGLRVRLVEHVDRPTPLEGGADGIVDWLRMFGGQLLDGVPADLREQVSRDAAERCRPTLYRDGRWVADYVRLRFVAIREIGSEAPRRAAARADTAPGRSR